jgi:hypothetical protein
MFQTPLAGCLQLVFVHHTKATLAVLTVIEGPWPHVEHRFVERSLRFGDRGERRDLLLIVIKQLVVGEVPIGADL